MDKEEILKEILDNPSKYYTNAQLSLLASKIHQTRSKGSMRKFIKKVVEYDKDREFIFTDGSCINNGKKNARGAYAVFFNKNDLRNKVDKINGKITNNVAELTAILMCLKMLSPLGKYYIVTDSEYSINCITKWSKGWEVNGWKTAKGTPVQNKEIIQEILQLMETMNVKFIHIESHKDKPKDKTSIEYKLWYGNYMADKLCNNLASD